MMQHVLLVNSSDEPVGTMEKLEAHQKGLLHRAFSVFVFNDKEELLLQRRALDKYHSGGLWTNTCCSHPYPEETATAAGERRLSEEMGFTTPLTDLFSFEYRVQLDNELIEHELDHVLIGHYNGNFQPNTEEVMDSKWIAIPQLIEEMRKSPESYTSWLRIILTDHLHRLAPAPEYNP